VNLLLGVTGGIAAYKACELVSLATKRGHLVRVVMTASATRFVGAVTFEALSGQPVMLDTFRGESPGGMDHIAWTKWADVVAVAPLSANTLGKLACGLADDALSTALMAVPRGTPVVLAPAMNTEMWFHPVVQRNLRWLAELGRYRLVDPVEKRLACGDVGVGGLADPADILAAIEATPGASAP
jgi:phosphopantothenoylcysteine decarboxylase/phosphopantothenate--cysteine ligase